jgi:hypothetical protein
MVPLQTMIKVRIESAAVSSTGEQSQDRVCPSYQKTKKKPADSTSVSLYNN